MSASSLTDPPGVLVARLLTGSWRAEPAPAAISVDEAAVAAPLLLRTGSAGLAWRKLRESPAAGSQAGRQLQQAYRLHLLRHVQRERAVEAAVACLRAREIDPILIKGWAAARLYPEPGARPYGDVDLCVRPEVFNEARAALRERADRFPVDLHAGYGKPFIGKIDALYARSERVRLGETEVRVLGPEDHLRLLCLHFLRHGAWRPLWLCDVAAAVENRPDGFAWETCLGRGLHRHWVLRTLGLAHALLEMDLTGVPGGEDLRNLPAWLPEAVTDRWGDAARLRRPERFPQVLRRDYGRPGRIFRAARQRWPGPVEASITCGAPLNGVPRFPFQLAAFVRHIHGGSWRAARSLLNSACGRPESD
jgi:hypothetical protein